MTRFIIIGSTDDYLPIFMNDIINDPDVLLINQKRPLNWSFHDLICRVCLRIGNFAPFIWPFLIFGYNLYFHYITDNANIKRSDSNIFLLFDVRGFCYNRAFLQYLRKIYNAKLILIFYNPLEKTPYKESVHRKYYDLLGVYEHYSERKYSALYLPPFYSKIDVEPAECSDIFFVGSSKGRIDLLHKIFISAKKQNVKCNFYIVGVENCNVLFPDEIHYNKYLSYEEVVSRIKGTKCVLEVIQQDATGCTLRTLESIVYNKQLITNSEEIYDFEMFDSRYMHHIEDPDTFDFSFIFENTSIEYNTESISFRNTLNIIQKELNK